MAFLQKQLPTFSAALCWRFRRPGKGNLDRRRGGVPGSCKDSSVGMATGMEKDILYREPTGLLTLRRTETPSAGYPGQRLRLDNQMLHPLARSLSKSKTDSVCHALRTNNRRHGATRGSAQHRSPCAWQNLFR